MIEGAELNEKERAALAATIEVMRTIRDLTPNGTNPANFENEAIPAIHTLQMFVIMHWAHRVNPEEFGDWFVNLPSK